MKVTYYLSDDNYHGVTDESPQGFANCVYAGRGPRHHQGPESVHEQGYSISQLQRWEKVDPTDVPDEWLDAIGYEKRPERKPKPERKPMRFEIKDQERLESLEKVVKMLEAGMVPPEPEPEPTRLESRGEEIARMLEDGDLPFEPEPVKLDWVPWKHDGTPMDNPMFWPLAIMIFIILLIIFRGCI